jgi:hypothetical protein
MTATFYTNAASQALVGLAKLGNGLLRLRIRPSSSQVFGYQKR